MGKSAPAPGNYTGAATKQAQASQQATGQQTAANRPNQASPFGFSNWTQGPDGSWNQSLGFNGPLGDASAGLNTQAAANMASPMDWSQFGALDDGSAAREQAINASFNAQASRLNPMFANREASMRTQLANQGLDPNSQAARGASSDLNASRNDAFSGAMNSAIREGTQAQQATFNQNMMARQQQIAEALRRRGQPMEEMAGLQRMLQMPGFMGAGQAQVPEYLRALMGQDAASLGAWDASNRANADVWQGGFQALGGAAQLAPALFALSDERAKTNIERLDLEALPGVPWATWDYLPEHGGARGLGIIAQDVQKVRPDLVRTRPDGLLEVDYSFLRAGA